LIGQSHFMLIFLIRINSVKWLCMVDFDCRLLTRWPLFCKSLVRVVFLRRKFGGFIVFYYVFKNCLFVEKNGSLHFNYSCCRKVVLWMDDPVYSDCHRNTKKINSALVIDERQKGKNPPNEFPLYSVHRNHVEWLCGITSTPYYECSRSHQLRTMNDRGHINSVPWMYAVTQTPYHEW
jgi:hypothetical protein